MKKWKCNEVIMCVCVFIYVCRCIWCQPALCHVPGRGLWKPVGKFCGKVLSMSLSIVPNVWLVSLVTSGYGTLVSLEVLIGVLQESYLSQSFLPCNYCLLNFGLGVYYCGVIVICSCKAAPTQQPGIFPHLAVQPSMTCQLSELQYHSIFTP